MRACEQLPIFGLRHRHLQIANCVGTNVRRDCHDRAENRNTFRKKEQIKRQETNESDAHPQRGPEVELPHNPTQNHTCDSVTNEKQSVLQQPKAKMRKTVG